MNTETESSQPLFCCQCGDKSGPFRAWDFTRKGDLNCIPCSVIELDRYINNLQCRRHQIDLDKIVRLEEMVEQLLFRNEQLERESTSQKNGEVVADVSSADRTLTDKENAELIVEAVKTFMATKPQTTRIP